jgi:hypothetical protein
MDGCSGVHSSRVTHRAAMPFIISSSIMIIAASNVAGGQCQW